MRFSNLLWLCTTVVSLLQPATCYVDNGKTQLIQWDRDSLIVDGVRAMIFSGEFHYPRLPVPELWLDVFQKLKANGFNTASVYFFWQFHEVTPGVFDFETGAKNIQRVFDYAKEAGIWIIARPGPYVNAEATAGGVAFWTATGAYGTPRTAQEANYQAWLPFITKTAEIIAKNQYTSGGPVVLIQHENEFVEYPYKATDTKVLYMEQLIDAYNKAGILIPSTHNGINIVYSPSWSTDYSNVGGAVDIAGADSYPADFNCANPDSGFNVNRGYYDFFQKTAFTQPSFLAEFQGGSYDPWGGAGYDKCALLTGNEFSDVFYKDLIGQKASMINLYMAYGGTNWGHMAAPVVYTSYDYGAPIAESRIVRDKARQAKLLGLFLRVSTDLRQTNYMGAGTNFTNNKAIHGSRLVNPQTGANFYIFGQNDSPSHVWQPFQAYLDTGLGYMTVSSNLYGRESKIMVTNYRFGTQYLAYATSEVLTYSIVDGKEVLVLYLNQGQFAEFVIENYVGSVTFNGGAVTKNGYSVVDGKHTKIYYTQLSGWSVVQLNNGVRVVLVDRINAWKFWAPTLTTNPEVNPDQHIIVAGPYLVRTVSWNKNNLYLVGDLNSTTPIEIFASSTITGVNWNGVWVQTSRSKYGSMYATLAGPASYTLPSLTNLDWRYIDSLPEAAYDYNDNSKQWVTCANTKTSNPIAPGTLPVLYADDYGFHVGSKIYRGYFSNYGAPTGITLDVAGGNAFGYSVWINGQFLGSYWGNPNTANSTNYFSLKGITINKDNVMTVLVDYNGHDEEPFGIIGIRGPRGIRGAWIYGTGTGKNAPNFWKWKMTGNAGGEPGVDALRHPYNEGGLFAERLGYHLPGYNTASWNKKSPLTGLNKAGVEFYTSTFNLALPANHDIPLAIQLYSPAGSAARVQIFINGYQVGKYNSFIGPQTSFPVQPGIINTNGKNTIALTIWSQAGGGARLESVNIVSLGEFTSTAVGYVDGAYLQTGYQTWRTQYA